MSGWSIGTAFITKTEKRKKSWPASEWKKDWSLCALRKTLNNGRQEKLVEEPMIASYVFVMSIRKTILGIKPPELSDLSGLLENPPSFPTSRFKTWN